MKKATKEKQEFVRMEMTKEDLLKMFEVFWSCYWWDDFNVDISSVQYFQVPHNQ